MNLCVSTLYDDLQPGTDIVIFSPEKIYMQEWEAKTFIEKASNYAVNHSVYALTPMFALNDRIAVCLIDESGKPACIQYACRLTPDIANAYTAADKLVTAQTPFGKLLITVDVDIYDPELTHIASAEKCGAIIATQYIPAPDFSKERILFGAWRASQQTGLYTVSVSNQGHCITEPCKSAPDSDRPNGFAAAFDSKLPFYFTLDIQEGDHV